MLVVKQETLLGLCLRSTALVMLCVYREGSSKPISLFSLYEKGEVYLRERGGLYVLY